MKSILWFCLIISIHANGQKDATKIGTLKGDIITDSGTKNVYNKTVYRIITEANKNKILLVNKYIDTAKPISIFFGTNKYEQITPKILRNGFSPFTGAFVLNEGGDLLKIILKGNRLGIYSKIKSFDGKYIAIIEDNLLIPYNQRRIYASDKFFEIFDEYDIPVLQIELVKKENAIYFSGAFNHSSGYTIMNRDGFTQSLNYRIPNLYLSQGKRDSILYMYLQEAKKIRPIHQ